MPTTQLTLDRWVDGLLAALQLMNDNDDRMIALIREVSDDLIALRALVVELPFG